MIYSIIVFLFLFFGSFTHLESFQMNSLGPFCVKAYDAGTDGDRQAIRFYNSCPEDLYINVCVVDITGQPKLFPSTSRVMYNGNYTITTLPGMYPSYVEFAGSPFSPPIPQACSEVASPQPYTPYPYYGPSYIPPPPPKPTWEPWSDFKKPWWED